METLEYPDDEDGAQHFLAAYGSRLKMCSNRLFVKLDTGIWSCDDKVVQNTLIGMSMSMDLYMNGRPYSKNVYGAKRMIKTVKAIIKPDPDFVATLWSSNIGYLVYRDGIYDVRRKRAVAPHETHDIESTILINRDIPIRNEALMAEVEEKLWSRLLPKEDERAYCKTLLARGLAGEIQDKRFGVFRGDRNCGKGVTTIALQAAFGAYIGSINSENFIYKGRAPVVDQAKSQSWMLAHEFTRLAISQEIHIEESDPQPSKINGNMIKRFASGGDVLQARLNYNDETDFKVQARLIMFMNDLPKFSTADAMETMDYIDFPNRFVSAEDKASSLYVNDPTVFAADENIKAWLTRPDVVDAFALTVLDAYSRAPSVPESVRRGKEELMDGLRETDQLDDLFDITKVATDRLSNVQIERHSRWVNMSMLHKKKHLMRKGAIMFRDETRRGLAGLKMKIPSTDFVTSTTAPPATSNPSPILSDQAIGYIYLIHEREFLSTNNPTYKIGCTVQGPDNQVHRLRSYKKGSKIIMVLSVDKTEVRDIETAIKREFRDKFTRHTDGTEYFTGDVKEMRDIVIRHCA